MTSLQSISHRLLIADTAVYSIAYDASTCAIDSGSYGNLSGFTTMQQIASDSSKFYCLNPPRGQTCNSAAASSLARSLARSLKSSPTSAST